MKVCDFVDCDTEARLYPCGLRCDTHSPWALAGHTLPSPDPAIAAELAARAIRPVGTLDVTSGLNDDRAIASGKRRASAAAYRLARANEDERRQRR